MLQLQIVLQMHFLAFSHKCSTHHSAPATSSFSRKDNQEKPTCLTTIFCSTIPEFSRLVPQLAIFPTRTMGTFRYLWQTCCRSKGTRLDISTCALGAVISHKAGVFSIFGGTREPCMACVADGSSCLVGVCPVWTENV